ncbi:MAG: methanol dehydrogenase [Proteobacteria bacterium]|nr:methanol dehydrogenase [Pseudomonadota bacterium]NOG60075.1 methanol dehydrogenase [Pseudomonadota bacterium]
MFSFDCSLCRRTLNLNGTSLREGYRYSIEEYGVRLGRHWGIGQKEKNNGVLLIVAKKERKVRIEVGYGLEGMLTDVISSSIINREIVPQFKKGKFKSGIERGTIAIIKATKGQYKIIDYQSVKTADENFEKLVLIGFFSFITFFLVSFSILGIRQNRLKRLNGSNSDDDSSWSWGSSSSGGFSGGGGSFGGGGASGSW